MNNPDRRQRTARGILFDYNAEGKVVGIEMLNPSKRANRIDLTCMQLEPIYT